MNVLLISYGDLDYDGRLRSLVHVFEEIGVVYSFTRGSNLITENGELCNVSYPKFIKKCIAYAKSLGKIDILVLDNRKASVPGLIIRNQLHPKYVIQDCRELYLLREVKYFSGKIGCLFEKTMVKRADIVICANKERAEIMKKEYRLEKSPLSYENLRMLKYSSDAAKEQAEIKFSEYIKEDEVRIISSSGCSIKRTNDVLVKQLQNVEKKCKLFLVGNSEVNEEKIIREIAANNTKDEVVILGQLNQDELKYLISKCHIGIVNYGQYDTNNRLCASGKLFEFLYEGIPVVTTTNPPLKNICEEAKVGMSDDRYFHGINEIIRNYDYYLNNVRGFIKDHTIESNDLQLIDAVKRTLKI